MLNERKLSENELDQREIVLKGLLKNKRALVKKYGKNAEKVMYGIATKQAKKIVEGNMGGMIPSTKQRKVNPTTGLTMKKGGMIDMRKTGMFYGGMAKRKMK